MKAIAATPQVPQWQETEAQFQIIAHDISDLKTENTLLGSLLQQNNKTLKAVLEKDQKTVLSFTIHYEAPVKLNNTKERKQQTITQYGLYQTLNPKVQAVLDPHNPSSTIKIRFALNDPILIQFRVNQDFIAAPPLLTNTIDDDWTAASK
ncbi:hypothetical protein [Candidatus Tisiphia endosymbiont of Nemotelus uliginosus]|uniref:hypothetical protein n=1 Tax=Candidatus Tisiphia endosymbiont of Nemotelus uliginosus TaxID=3077926 RepID=UPI0035C8991C